MNALKLDTMTLLVLLVIAGFVLTTFWVPEQSQGQNREATHLSQSIVETPVVSNAMTNDEMELIQPVKQVVHQESAPSAL